MMKILEYIGKGDSQTTEFKLFFHKEIITLVGAFANAQDSKVFTGLSDDGKIVGVDIQQESLQNWINQMKFSITLSVIPDICIEIISNVIIVVIDVKEYLIKLISLEKVSKFMQKIEKTFNKSFDDTPMQVLQNYGLERDDKIIFGTYLLFVKDFCFIFGVQARRFKTSIDIIECRSIYGSR